MISDRSEWNPVVAGFEVFAFHCGPSDAMGCAFALFGAACPILRPRIIEGGQIDFLGVQWQMCPDGWRKVVDRCIGQGIVPPSL